MIGGFWSFSNTEKFLLSLVLQYLAQECELESNNDKFNQRELKACLECHFNELSEKKDGV